MHQARLVAGWMIVLLGCVIGAGAVGGCRSGNEEGAEDATRVAEVTPRVGVAAAEPVEEQDEAYASIRVVREVVGARSRPEVQLPAGYRLYDRQNYSAASPGEYYTFLGGAKGVARGVRIRWPGQEIHAVVHNDQRLEMRTEGDSVLVDVPMESPSLRGAWGTLEVFSFLNEKDLSVRVEHNHPARRAGEYARIPWVDGQAQAALNFVFAARHILRDWGIHHQLAEQGAGGLSLMGFESNNPLHGDFPPHWHLIYYWPGPDGKPGSGVAGSQIPHFYMDSYGRVYENKVDVMGRPGESRRLKAGEPMVYTDPSGNVRMAAEVRPDGGINLGTGPGEYRYAIVDGEGDGDFRESVRVLKDGRPWAVVAVEDDVDGGVMTVRVRPLGAEGEVVTEVVDYDALTGVVKKGGKE